MGRLTFVKRRGNKVSARSLTREIGVPFWEQFGLQFRLKHVPIKRDPPGGRKILGNKVSARLLAILSNWRIFVWTSLVFWIICILGRQHTLWRSAQNDKVSKLPFLSRVFTILMCGVSLFTARWFALWITSSGTAPGVRWPYAVRKSTFVVCYFSRWKNKFRNRCCTVTCAKAWFLVNPVHKKCSGFETGFLPMHHGVWHVFLAEDLMFILHTLKLTS